MLPPVIPRTSRPVPVVPAAPAPEPPGDRVERFLCDLITALVPADAPTGRGRPRILPALALWAGLVVGVLRGFDRQRALWRLLRSQGLWHFPRFEVSDEAVYRRLADAGTDPLERLFADVTTLLLARPVPAAGAELAPFAAEVVALDETTLDPVARSLPSLRPVPPGDALLLPGKLTGVFDLRRQL